MSTCDLLGRLTSEADAHRPLNIDECKLRIREDITGVPVHVLPRDGKHAVNTNVKSLRKGAGHKHDVALKTTNDSRIHDKNLAAISFVV